MKYCSKCENLLPDESFYLRKNRKLSGYCKSCHSLVTKETQHNRYIKRKKSFVELKGGRCSACGYDKNLAALCFHHRDPSNKRFSLDKRHIHATSLALLELELAKCDLLCNNCHMELHYPDLTT